MFSVTLGFQCDIATFRTVLHFKANDPMAMRPLQVNNAAAVTAAAAAAAAASVGEDFIHCSGNDLHCSFVVATFSNLFSGFTAWP